MKIRKKYAGILPALVVSLSLAACGGGGDDIIYDTVDGVDEEAPETIENLAIDDSIEYDYSAFPGTWPGEDNKVLAAEKYDDGRVHFTLSDANDDWIASGIFQYVEEYGCVYAHNDYDGIAYLCRFDGDNKLNIESFGTFGKTNGDAPAETVVDKSADAPQTIYDSTTIGKPDEYDYSDFLGKWIGTDGTTLTVEEDSGKGAPFVLLDRYGSQYTVGAFKYIEEYGCVYADDELVDVASKCWFNENGRLEIPGFSIFSKVTGDESDYVVLYGTWYLDGEEPPKKCIEFDSSGTMWSIYVRQDNGLLDGVNGGTLRETGANRYEAVSDWNDNETFDCYIKDDCLYWGSEDGGYELYY